MPAQFFLVRREVRLASFDAQIGRAPNPDRCGSEYCRYGSVAFDHSRICDRMIAPFSHRRAPDYRVHRRHRAGGETQAITAVALTSLIFTPHSALISAS
jgi:hypothetical protein